VLQRLHGEQFNLGYTAAVDIADRGLTPSDLDAWLKWKSEKPSHTHSMMLANMKKFSHPAVLPKDSTMWEAISQESQWSEEKCQQVGETLSDYWPGFVKPKAMGLALRELSRWPSDSVIAVLDDIKMNQEVHKTPGMYVFLEALRAKHAPRVVQAPRPIEMLMSWSEYKEGVRTGRYTNATMEQVLEREGLLQGGLGNAWGKAWGKVMDEKEKAAEKVEVPF
jgi:hypothetical protein